jgi:hypothetical protein
MDPETFDQALAHEDALRDTTPAAGDVCTVCGLPIAVGEFPCISAPRPHGRALPSKGFEPHFDVGLGQHVTGWGDVRQAMRRNKMDFRDHPSAGELSARRDREQQRKAGR